MKIKLQAATADDVADLVSLQNAVAQDLTSRHGKGHWSSNVSDKGVLFAMKRSTVYVAKCRKRLLGTFALSDQKAMGNRQDLLRPERSASLSHIDGCNSRPTAQGYRQILLA